MKRHQTHVQNFKRQRKAQFSEEFALICELLSLFLFFSWLFLFRLKSPFCIQQYQQYPFEDSNQSSVWEVLLQDLLSSCEIIPMWGRKRQSRAKINLNRSWEFNPRQSTELTGLRIAQKIFKKNLVLPCIISRIECILGMDIIQCREFPLTSPFGHHSQGELTNKGDF